MPIVRLSAAAAQSINPVIPTPASAADPPSRARLERLFAVIVLSCCCKPQAHNMNSHSAIGHPAVGGATPDGLLFNALVLEPTLFGGFLLKAALAVISSLALSVSATGQSLTGCRYPGPQRNATAPHPARIASPDPDSAAPGARRSQDDDP